METPDIERPVRSGSAAKLSAGAVRTFRNLVGCNRRICAHIGPRLRHVRFDINDAYLAEVARRMRTLDPGAVVVDVGGGRSCRFASSRPAGVRLVAVDISDEELRLNRDVDEWRVGDCSRKLPLADGEAAMVVSSSAVEHFEDVAGFVAESARALRPGGLFINTFPSRFAPFALMNRLLPYRLSRQVLRAVFPWSEGILGFRAYYDRCHCSGFIPLLRRNGFRVDRLEVSYSQSSYFDFLLPLYVASLSYESVVSALRARDLAAYLMVSGRRHLPGRASAR